MMNSKIRLPDLVPGFFYMRVFRFYRRTAEAFGMSKR
jgi:hypothetical protein